MARLSLAARPYIIIAAANVLTVPLEATAWAQLTGDQAVAAAAAERSNLPPDAFGGEGALGKIGDDFFFTLAMRINFDRENWGVGFQLPLRFRLTNRDMHPEDYLGSLHLRHEDWNQWQDYFRLIRYVYVGQADKKGPFYVRIGELFGLTVGHGTIVYRYLNDIDLNQWYTGINAAVNIGPFGGEAVLSDFSRPHVAGLRFTVRPLELALGEGWPWDKLVFGTSVIVDPTAPRMLQRQTDANNNPTNMIATDPGTGLSIVTDQKAFAIYGADVGIEVFSNELLSITPYIDLNHMTLVNNGWGLHMGILWEARLPVVIDTLTLDARTEYRRVSGDYIGPYFDTTYEIERYQTLGNPLVTKLTNTLTSSIGARNGVFFSLLAGLPSLAYIGGEYIAYDGTKNDGSLRLSLEVPALKIVKFSAFYYRINVAGLSDLFKLDDRSAIVATASIPLYYIFSLNLRWWRVWQEGSDGQYHHADDWSVGVGFNLQL